MILKVQKGDQYVVVKITTIVATVHLYSKRITDKQLKFLKTLNQSFWLHVTI